MRLPRWLRRTIATWKVWTRPEYGGLITNWNNGAFDIIHKWQTNEGMEEAANLVENMLLSQRDEIYVGVVKQGRDCGYFTIHAGLRYHFPVAFWKGYFSIDEAFVVVRNRCREIGTKMGYRNPEVNNAQTADNQNPG